MGLEAYTPGAAGLLQMHSCAPRLGLSFSVLNLFNISREGKVDAVKGKDAVDAGKQTRKNLVFWTNNTVCVKGA